MAAALALATNLPSFAAALPAHTHLGTLRRPYPLRGGATDGAKPDLSNSQEFARADRAGAPIAALGPFAKRQDSGGLSTSGTFDVLPSMSTTSLSQMDVGCLGGVRRVPKTIDLLMFMIPTFGIYLANPILSLVDTATVGQYCDASELASLGPGCALCDMVVYLANFLAVATTSLLARAVANNDIPAARRHVGVGFSIAVGIGMAMSAVLFVCGEALVGLFAGSGEAARETLSRSLDYVHIRGLGSAPTLLAMVAQAACIGAKDADSPLRAIAVVSIFNVFLDWLLVGPLKLGGKGAAWATTIAQVVLGAWEGVRGLEG